ncbi:MAG TPA: ROK family protein [Terriglobales bacterium]|nr:ROK family protein [Terriglobales bacterium]
MSGKLVIGVDIGGTKVAAGLVSAQGEILQQARVPMVSTGDAATGLAAVTRAVRDILRNARDPQVSAIGVCCPGPLDPKTGVVINPPNLTCWRQFPLADAIAQTFGIPVAVDNDANAAALAETLWGAASGYRHVFYGTIGTGIGTGIVLDGRIYEGATGAAGEGGHMGIDINGPTCPCGKRGCIEVLASGPAIAKRARKKLMDGRNSKLLELSHGNSEDVTSEMVSQAYRSGDVVATEVMQETLRALAYWLGNIIDLLDPDIIVLGGGVANMFRDLLDDIRRRLRGACVNPSAQHIPIVLARYGEDAGIAGAAALVRAQAASSAVATLTQTK